MKKPINATEAKAIKESGLYRAGDTLYLYVGKNGSKSWIQRLKVNSKRHDIGLGSFSLVTLAEAKEKALANRRLARIESRNPLAEKRKSQAPIFRDAATRTLEMLSPTWRSAKGAANWWARMEQHVFPRMGDIHVNEIDRAHVLAVLTPIWTSKPETGRKVRQGIKATLEWCQAHGFIEHNFAGDAISGALPSMPAVKENFRSLPYAEIPEALETIRASRSSVSAKACLEFVILTACRSGEARLAKWEEIDLEKRTWTIPASRMKAGKEHRQPLNDAALAVLEQAKFVHDGSDLIFPSPTKKGKPLSDMSLTKMLRDMGLAERATVHGFRSTFRTWASENTNADHAVMELCLAHAVGSAVEQAYARSDLFTKRARLLAQWGSFVVGDDAGRRKVVALHG